MHRLDALRRALGELLDSGAHPAAVEARRPQPVECDLTARPLEGAPRVVGHRGRGAKVAPALRVRSTDDRLDLLRGRRRARLALHELAQRGAVDRAGAVGGHLGKESAQVEEVVARPDWRDLDRGADGQIVVEALLG